MNCSDPEADISNQGRQQENIENTLRTPSSVVECEVERIGSYYLVPKLGAEFESEAHAYDCYSKFAVSEGFSIRKDFVNKSRVNGTVVSRRYTCYRQGRGSSRTGCPAHMTIARRPDNNNKFWAVDFENDHNHELATSSTTHLLPSHKRLTFAQAVIANNCQCSVDSDFTPKLGLGFGSEEEAYGFYNGYAGRIGFGVRKDYVNRSKVDGAVVSRRFTCFKEGFRQRDKRDPEVKFKVKVKNPRKDTRIGCPAQMVISRQSDGKYRVTHFEEAHNHELVAPCRVHLLRSQKRPLSAQIERTETDYGMRLPFKSAAGLSEEEAGKLLKYFQDKNYKNPDFFYSIQLDIEGRVTNVFWVEGKMVTNYGDFGDVVCFDTTYTLNKDSRPFAVFLGINHHKQIVIFGSALLYDETFESFEWLFQTFDKVMSGKKPKTILTDHNMVTMSEAIDSVFIGTSRRICIWHIYQNTLKQLDFGSGSFTDDLIKCLFGHAEEDGFNLSWKSMLDFYGLWENEWLNSIYEEREKWAIPFGKNFFCADIMNVLRTGSNFGKYLKPESDVILWLRHLSKVVNDSHYKELEANYEMTRNPPKIMGDVILLNQAIDIYTPPIFELCQKEYEMCLDMVVNRWTCVGVNFEYAVSLYGQQKEYKVNFDLTEETILCKCMKFESVGVLCSHALKVLDFRNLKLIPDKYILKRWTRNARV